MCEPSARPLADHGLVHATAAPPSRLHVVVADESDTVNATVALVTWLELFGPDVMVTAGAEFSTVQLTEVDPVPETFVAKTTRLWAPGDSPDADHGLEHGEAGAPSRLHVTVAAGSDTVNDADAFFDDPGPLVTATTGTPEGGATTVQLYESDPEPPAFDAPITTVCAPSANPDAVQGLAHDVAAPPSRLHVTDAAGSDTVNDTDANVADVDAAGPPVTATTGATGTGGNTVQLYEFDAEPPAFFAPTTTVCAPSANPDAVQGLAHDVAAPPSRLHVTDAAGSDTVNDTDANVADVDAAGPPVTATTGAGSTAQL